MNYVRLYLISVFTILAASCSEKDVPDAPKGIEGVWRLSDNSHFGGFHESYDERNQEQTLRLYGNDSTCYEVKTLADGNGIMIVPQERIVYTVDCVDDTTYRYTENDYVCPFQHLSDTVITIQKIGFKSIWIRQEASEEFCRAVVKAFETDADGNYAGCQSVFASEQNLKKENSSLQYVLTFCLVLLAGIGLYLLHVMRRRRRTMDLLRRIRNESGQRPQQLNAALKQVEEDFEKSDYYIELHRRITRGDRFDEADWREMESQVKKAYPNFVRHLLTLLPLSEVEFRTCMLIRLSVPPSNMADVLHRDLSSISTIRSRLYQKVFGKKGSSHDWDEFLLSL